NVSLPGGWMVTSVSVGWVIDRKIIDRQLNIRTNSLPWVKLLIFILRYIAPAAIALIFLNSLGII
ncbi:MAG: sodium-dependent transporter, partial [Paramuribaculum sp.]|nr:sodium-dependent transporter [Paramuribaculum sp.]